MDPGCADLGFGGPGSGLAAEGGRRVAAGVAGGKDVDDRAGGRASLRQQHEEVIEEVRSEERRVGKECRL